MICLLQFPTIFFMFLLDDSKPSRDLSCTIHSTHTHIQSSSSSTTWEYNELDL